MFEMLTQYTVEWQRFKVTTDFELWSSHEFCTYQNLFKNTFKR